MSLLNNNMHVVLDQFVVSRAQALISRHMSLKLTGLAWMGKPNFRLKGNVFVGHQKVCILFDNLQ